jgi:quercetin dioxygenase-like cupin family protein
MDAVYQGNAITDSQTTRGWFIGGSKFLDDTAGIRNNPNVEIKWGAAKAGDKRPEWAGKATTTTVCIHISGKCKLLFPGKEVILEQPGDYVMWGPGVDHSWEIIDDCLNITVRWPAADK